MSKIEVRFSQTIGSRGVFAKKSICKDELIEVAPVIVLPKEEGILLRQTIIYNYFFQWGQSGEMALCLGLGSMYNHHDLSPTAKHVRDFANQSIQFIAIKNIEEGEEILVNYLANYSQAKTKTKVWFKETQSS